LLRAPLKKGSKHGGRYITNKMAIYTAVLLVMLAISMSIAMAAGIGDVVTEVAVNLGSPKFDFGTEDVTGLNIKMHLAMGDLGAGYGALSVVGPVDPAGMKALLARVVDVAGQTGVKTTPMMGGEVREYQMSNGIGLTVKLPDYLITVEIYKSGNSIASDMQTAKRLAQSLLDGLERNGLLKQPAPKIDGASVADKELVPASAAVVTGKALDKPVAVSNTDNIAGVQNGPTAPTTFSLNGPHLLTYIRNYHWNKGKGAKLGTIAVRDQNGKIYGPWQASGTPGMGGVPNANWEVSPNVVLPAGTYTVVDSDPSTWSANAESGGRGMGQVHATPHFEITSGSIKDLTATPGGSGKTGGNSQTESQAGVGSVGNIPGPANITEAVVGVVIPGLIATGMGALAGLGGGGFAPPGGTPLAPTGGGSPLGGGSSPMGGTARTSVTPDVTQLGRRRREPEIDIGRQDDYPNAPPAPIDGFIDTVDMFKGQKPLTVGNITEATKAIAGSGLIIDKADEAGISLPASVSKDAGISIDTSELEKLESGKDLIVGEGAVVSKEASSVSTTAAAYDEQGYDKNGYNRDGWDKDGFGRNGLDKAGFDREGYDQAGYNKAGYNREGFDKEGKQHDGYDEYGYDKQGFNKDGFDKDGYDREGFNYEGYSRGGYDPWGFNRQGYSKDGYHWSGYNSDGYNREGRHWSENPTEGDSPFNVDTRNPFDGGPVVIGEWKPTKPPLGEPYPRTLEKYGAKPWATDTPTAKPTTPESDSGIIGPEDPMNTLKHHGVNKTPSAGQDGAPGPVEQKPGETIPKPGDKAVKMPSTQGQEPTNAPTQTGEVTAPDGFPRDGEKKVLVGSTDGRSTEIEYDGKTGTWKNTENGNTVDPDRFQKWQDDIAEDRRRSAEDIDKMSKRTDANSKAIDEAMNDWKKLEQMEKTADKYGIGEKGGPGDVDKAIQDLKDDMLAGKEADRDKMDRINNVIDSRIKGDSATDTGNRWEEKPWYEDLDSALKANAETVRNVVTGQDAEGNISWVGIGARTAIGAATGGASEYIMTVAEALSRVKEGIDNNGSGFRATARAIGMVVMEESISRYFEAAGKLGFDEMARRYPVLTNKVADAIENGVLKITKANQAASAALGMVSKESAAETIEQINKQLTEKTADAMAAGTDQITRGAQKGFSGTGEDVAGAAGKAASGTSDDTARAAGKAASDGGDEVAGTAGKAASEASDDAARAADKVNSGVSGEVAKAKKSIQETMEDFDKLRPAKQQELIKEQVAYDEYRIKAEEKAWELPDKVQRSEPLSVKDALDMKADPASMRTLKDINDVDGLGAELGTGGARQVQTEFNNVLNNHVYQPSYKDVQGSLSVKYGGAEIRVETVRTPGKEYHPWDVNTDNDIIALRKLNGPNGTEWVEVPWSEWEDVYFESYAKHTGFNPDDAVKKFPAEDWSKLSSADQARKWAELHGESPTDVYHPEGARDFSTQRTSILDGQRPDRAAAAQAADGEGTLLDAEGLGMMEKNKINHYWEKGDIRNQTEAMEQLKKAGAQAQALEKGYQDMGYKIADMPDNMQKALDAVNDRGLSPATRAARLQELGYDTPGDFVDKLTSRIGALRAACK